MTEFSDLLDGYRRFRAHGWARERERWAALSEGQRPGVMVIACSDSRVDPAQIFDASPGEMFVVRNVGALAPPCEWGGGFHGVSAALEFAVTQLEVEEIVVMGHGACGGCAAALAGTFQGARAGEGGFIAHWIELLDPARERVLAAHPDPTSAEAADAMEHEAVRVSLDNLRTFPFVAEREAAGALTLHGAWFAIGSGMLHLYDEQAMAFRPA
ncbi:MAG: carbonic anhydrase [Sphingomonadaceae bacterium]|nr:carbonic anhydrase [Sphingomonadaceae bacterium]